MCVYAYMYVYVCIIYWGNCPKGEKSYPKREGELSGAELSGGELSRGNCPTPKPNRVLVRGRARVKVLWIYMLLEGVEIG